MIRVDHYFHADELIGAINLLSEGIARMNATVDTVVASVAGLKADVASLKDAVALNSAFILALEQTVQQLLAGQTLPPAVEAALQGVLTDIAALRTDTAAATQAIADATDNDPATP